jgi:ribonuclease R
MKVSTAELYATIRKQATHPMKTKELAKLLQIRSSEYAAFRNQVKQLIKEGKLVKLNRGQIGVAEELSVLVGKISITRSGVGFLIRENNEDVLIPEHGLSTALDGDTVMVRLEGNRNGRIAGTIIRIMERATRSIVGVYHVGRNFSFIKPDNPRIHRDIYIPSNVSLDAKEGEKVVARLISWEDQYQNPEGEVIERLGFPGDHVVDMLSVLRGYGLPDAFPLEVLQQADQAASTPLDEEIARRIDLTNEDIYAIDPEDAKDHDDAISVTRTNEGYRLGVHIADVSFYVREGTLLDTEAYQRATSVYLPGMVIPMLPEVLSNDVCSLRADTIRLAHSAIMEFDRHGKMLCWERRDTVIKSKAKLTYEEVQRFFDTGEMSAGVKRVHENLTVARELAQILTNRRLHEGSIDFDLPEIKIVLDEQGKTIDLKNRERLESHRLVEECMLAANKAMAKEVSRAGLPMLYRVHDRPDGEKLEEFSKLMTRLGYTFPVSPTMKPSQFTQFLERIKDAPEKEFINELLLRSMKKAVYQRENIGHFGLAFTHYTHFTSPIRRYPDLFVHRLLRSMKPGGYASTTSSHLISKIDKVGEHCSEMERMAEQAEREAVKIKQVAYMEQHVGNEYGGRVSGVIAYGFFVRLDNLGAEGMVRLSSINDDYYQYDEKGFRIVGVHTGRIFRLGDRVQVRVIRVDRLRNEIDLQLVQYKEAAVTKRVRTARPPKEKLSKKHGKPIPVPRGRRNRLKGKRKGMPKRK